jgi:hypothetical protein
MKTNVVSRPVLSVVVLLAVLLVGILEIQKVYAQADATSSDPVATSSDTVTPPEATTGTTTDTETVAPSTEVTSSDVETAAPSDTTPAAETSSVAPTEPPPQGLTEVHIIGTKYIDYFTDGTTVTAYPGDPAIDAHLAEKDAPIPSRPGLTWVQTNGAHLYDTPSGDLEVGDYALQLSGTYEVNAPPVVSSTSTPAVLGASTSASDTPSDTFTSIATPTPTDTAATTSDTPSAQ